MHVLTPLRERLRRAFAFTDLAVLRHWLTGLVLVAIIAAIAVLVLDLQKQISRLATSASDNMQWTLGQAEVELLAIEVAALRATQDSGDLEEVRLRYDIFYSRVSTLTESHRFQQLLSRGRMPETMGIIIAFRTKWMPRIDGPDPELRAALPELAQDAQSIRAAVRQAMLIGIEYFSQVGDAERTSLGQTLLRIGMLTIALVTLLAVLALALLRLARESHAEATANRETRERIETILSTSLDAIIVSDAFGHIIDFNGAAERIFGYSRGEAIGADMAELIVPERYRDAHHKGMARFHLNGTRHFVGRGIVQLEALRRDGKVFPVDVSLAVAQSPAGEIFIAFLRDTSDRVNNEAALKRARDQAIAGERQKAELLAVMSHEMRTPLNGMLGTLELVDADMLDARHRRYLRIVRDSGKVLLGHVNDVLDVSKLDAGKMRLHRVRFDLVTLIQEIIDNQAQHARARGNTLVLVPPNPALHEVYSDPDRLRQILLNLVSNAIKFTSNGKITLEADCADGLDAVEIRVTDTGMGIAQEDLDRVFDDFVTINNSYRRNSSGTGLGLAISQRLALALDGELGAESELGDGSLFWLRLPMTPPPRRRTDAPDIVEPEAQPRLRPLDILLVEDNDINRIVATEMLEREGHRIQQAANGESALTIAAKTKFDVILMDISMPGIDGIEVARTLLKGDGVNARTPIIATTAHAMPQEVRQFYAAGMQAVLVKPLTFHAIRSALAEALDGQKPTLSIPPLPEDRGQLLNAAHLTEMQTELPPFHFEQVKRLFFTEMKAFVAAIPDQLAEDTPDLTLLSAEAHRMAGSAAVMGAERLTTLLRQMTLSAQAQDRTALTTQTTEIDKCWQATSAALDALTEATDLA